MPSSSNVFLDIQATIECGFTLKRVVDMARKYSQMHHTNKYSQHISINQLARLAKWFTFCLYKLSVYGFKSCCSHLNPKYIQNDLIWAEMSKPINELKRV